MTRCIRMPNIRETPPNWRNISSWTLSSENLNTFLLQKKPRIIDSKTLFLIIIAISLMTLTSIRAQTDDPASLYGVITGIEGDIEGAKISLGSSAAGPGQINVEYVTGPDGRYSFEGLTISKEYIVNVKFNQIDHSKAIFTENTTTQLDFSFTGREEVQIDLYDGSVADGVEVRLFNYLGVNEANSTTDSTGLAVFEGLNLNGDYYLYFFHRSIPYSKEFSFDDSKISSTVFDILEATTSDEDFKIFNHHIIIYTSGSELSYWDQVTYFNMGDQVFNTSFLYGWIPADATGISHDTMDCCITFLGKGDYNFDPMDPLFPLDHFDLELKYVQKIKLPTHVIEKKVIYDTEQMFFLIEEQEGITFEAIENLVYGGIDTYGDTRYLLYEGTNLTAGDIIKIEMTTKFSLVDFISRNQLIWGPVLLGVPVGLIYLYVSRKKDTPSNSLEEEKLEIFESLAQAEKDLSEHKITKKEFNKLRAKYQRRSIKVLKKIDKSEKLRTTHEEKPSPTLEEKPTDAISDLKAVEAVIKSIKKDYEDGTLSEDSYQATVSKYEERRVQLIKKIRESVEIDIEKGDGEQ